MIGSVSNGALRTVLVIFLIAGLLWKIQVETQRANTAEQDANMQSGVIATQAFNFHRFNQISAYTNNLNSLIDVRSEKTIIEYREVLRSEKNCDLPVPADIAGGLLKYADTLRAAALHADPVRFDQPSIAPATTSRMTYCQAVLWIKPLLAAIEKGNNKLAGIRAIEEERGGITEALH